MYATLCANDKNYNGFDFYGLKKDVRKIFISKEYKDHSLSITSMHYHNTIQEMKESLQFDVNIFDIGKLEENDNSEYPQLIDLSDIEINLDYGKLFRDQDLMSIAFNKQKLLEIANRLDINNVTSKNKKHISRSIIKRLSDKK